jgi:hypothetical protein
LSEQANTKPIDANLFSTRLSIYENPPFLKLNELPLAVRGLPHFFAAPAPARVGAEAVRLGFLAKEVLIERQTEVSLKRLAAGKREEARTQHCWRRQ